MPLFQSKQSGKKRLRLNNDPVEKTARKMSDHVFELAFYTCPPSSDHFPPRTISASDLEHLGTLPNFINSETSGSKLSAELKRKGFHWPFRFYIKRNRQFFLHENPEDTAHENTEPGAFLKFLLSLKNLMPQRKVFQVIFFGQDDWEDPDGTLYFENGIADVSIFEQFVSYASHTLTRRLEDLQMSSLGQQIDSLKAKLENSKGSPEAGLKPLLESLVLTIEDFINAHEEEEEGMLAEESFVLKDLQ